MKIKMMTESISPRLRLNQYDQDKNKDCHSLCFALFITNKNKINVGMA